MLRKGFCFVLGCCCCCCRVNHCLSFIFYTIHQVASQKGRGERTIGFVLILLTVKLQNPLSFPFVWNFFEILWKGVDFFVHFSSSVCQPQLKIRFIVKRNIFFRSKLVDCLVCQSSTWRWIGNDLTEEKQRNFTLLRQSNFTITLHLYKIGSCFNSYHSDLSQLIWTLIW